MRGAVAAALTVVGFGTFAQALPATNAEIAAYCSSPPSGSTVAPTPREVSDCRLNERAALMARIRNCTGAADRLGLAGDPYQTYLQECSRQADSSSYERSRARVEIAAGGAPACGIQGQQFSQWTHPGGRQDLVKEVNGYAYWAGECRNGRAWGRGKLTITAVNRTPLQTQEGQFDFSGVMIDGRFDGPVQLTSEAIFYRSFKGIPHIGDASFGAINLFKNGTNMGLSALNGVPDFLDASPRIAKSFEESVTAGNLDAALLANRRLREFQPNGSEAMRFEALRQLAVRQEASATLLSLFEEAKDRDGLLMDVWQLARKDASGAKSLELKKFLQNLPQYRTTYPRLMDSWLAELRARQVTDQSIYAFELSGDREDLRRANAQGKNDKDRALVEWALVNEIGIDKIFSISGKLRVNGREPVASNPQMLFGLLSTNASSSPVALHWEVKANLGLLPMRWSNYSVDLLIALDVSHAVRSCVLGMCGNSTISDRLARTVRVTRGRSTNFSASGVVPFSLSNSDFTDLKIANVSSSITGVEPVVKINSLELQLP